jgi:hypothetical protein
MTDITEFDCVEIGDFAAINRSAALQTHLYEVRCSSSTLPASPQ